MITFKDQLEIANLVSRYCLATDNADVDGFMACWVEPANFGGYESGPFGSMKTWEELRDFEAHHVGEGGMAQGKRHQATNLHIEAEGGDRALVTHDLLVLEVAEEPRIIATGRYNRSVVVKTDAGWRFQSRTLDVDPGFFKLMERMKTDAS